MSGNALIPAAVRITETSAASALIAALSLGHWRSGEVQSCHVTCVEEPKEALFMQPPSVAGAALAAFRSMKNWLACFGVRTKAWTLLCATPARFCMMDDAWPPDSTVILKPDVLVDPEFTIVARSAGAGVAAIAAAAVTAQATPIAAAM